MNTTYKATVRWFNRSSGEGMVRIVDEDGEMHTAVLYACNIPGKKTWFENTACVYYEEGQEIEVYISHGMVVGITPGIPDTKKWNSLDHSRLAFVCNDAGEAINGLFAIDTKKKGA